MEKELFLKALGLSSPWYIKEFKLDIEKERLDIYLDFEIGAKFFNVDGEKVGVEKTSRKVWKHLFFWQYPTYLHARVPSIKNRNGKVKMLELPWARKGSGFTLLFESMLLELGKHIPINKLGEQLQEDGERLMRVVNYYVTESRKQADYSKITKGGIDETSRKKGHNYLTTFINFETRKVSSIVEGKGAKTVEKIVEDIEGHGGSRNNITEVSIDFSPAFTSGVSKYMPKASIVYDKYHFMQFLNNAVDEVRRLETKSDKLLKGSKYLWLKNPKNLNEKKRLKLDELKAENKTLAEAYQMKENIKEFFEKETIQQAELFLKLWCDWVNESSIEPMKKVVKTIKSHWSGIMNYIEKKINNGVVEGLNSIIQTIKRRARGFRNFENFKNMIYLKIGDFPILSYSCIK